jgi:hypothetical protein
MRKPWLSLGAFVSLNPQESPGIFLGATFREAGDWLEQTFSGE